MIDIAIRVQNLSKRYEIYDTPRDRLKQFVMPHILRLAGQAHKKYFREFWALKDVSFEIKKGETVGIIGRNGSGKSTLLQLICGTLSPTGGNVETNGRIAALLELGSGFNPEFTGRENIYMNAAVLGLSKEEVDQRFDEIAAFADIGEFIEQPVKTYSSGMVVRLAFAVNILSNPEIMIVDEALAVGDMNFQAKCMTALTRVQEGGTTVLFVSQDIGAVKSLCSRGIYLEHGTVKAIGPAGDVAGHYIREMSEEMNAEHASTKPFAGTKAEAATPLESVDISEFKDSAEFEKQVAYFRHGKGGAKITFAELLDDHFLPINNVEFNQTVFIRIYLKTSIEDEISCNYYILDDKRNFILGAGLRLAGHPQMRVKLGGRYAVTYKSRLPLQEGNHSVRLEITKPIILDQTAIFLDVIDDALVFKVSRREGARIWAKVFVENDITIKSY
jgi:lipopolysaccharide transport system ATP-binding protein